MSNVAPPLPFREAATDAERPGRGRSRLWRFLPVAVLAAGLLAGYLAGLHNYLTLDTLAVRRGDLSAAVLDDAMLAALGFLLFCTIVTAFGFPAPSVLSVFGGFLFGWTAGGLLAALGATGGGTVMFLAARSAFGAGLRQRIGRYASRLARGFERDAFTYLLALRLAPFLPFVAINIAPALFRIRVSTFVLATVLGLLPLALVCAWLGEGIDAAFAAAAAAGRKLEFSDLMTPRIWLALAALTLVAILPAIVKRLRKRR